MMYVDKFVRGDFERCEYILALIERKERPTLLSLAGYSGLPWRSIQNIMRKLEDQQHVKFTRRGGTRHGYFCISDWGNLNKDVIVSRMEEKYAEQFNDEPEIESSSSITLKQLRAGIKAIESEALDYERDPERLEDVVADERDVDDVLDEVDEDEFPALKRGEISQKRLDLSLEFDSDVELGVKVGLGRVVDLELDAY